jgi:hypothetical protein
MSEPHWREAAMQAALQSEANYGNSTSTLIAQIRKALPKCSVTIINANRPQTLRFMEERATGFRSQLAGKFLQGEGESIHPYLGWWTVTWQGETIELVVPPGFGSCGEVVCLAVDENVVATFASALSDYTTRPIGRSLRYSGGWENAPDLDAELGQVTWEDLILPEELLTTLRNTATSFAEQRDAFIRLGFPWRRGVLLVGPPGTGKTMVCKAVATALPKFPFLYVRDIRDQAHQDALSAIFNRARRLAPCILVFEDVDGFVTDYNRTAFLNELDGFGSNEGLFIIASSNHPGRIDEALLKRPSRFDRVFHLGLPEESERRRYCEVLLQRGSLASHIASSLDSAALAANVAKRTTGFTPAYLKEAFLSAALDRAQSGHTELDSEFATAVMAQVEQLREHIARMKAPDRLSVMEPPRSGMGFGG